VLWGGARLLYGPGEGWGGAMGDNRQLNGLKAIDGQGRVGEVQWAITGSLMDLKTLMARGG
jgi:hypothetical protein